MRIDRFRGAHFFLSNLYLHPVRLGGVVYPCAEAAFQAAKTLDPAERARFVTCPASGLRRAGRQVTLRPGWDALRVEVMRGIVAQKFRHPLLAQLLVDTGEARLEEGNTHGDRFWGTVNGVGENQLGRLLMEVRADIRAAAEAAVTARENAPGGAGPV